MPKGVDHEERRDYVAAVAEQVIADRGLGAGLRDVAGAGGWSTSVVTHYFTKQELIEFASKEASVAEKEAPGASNPGRPR